MESKQNAVVLKCEKCTTMLRIPTDKGAIKVTYNGREKLDHFLGRTKMKKRYNKALKGEVSEYGNAEEA